MPRARPLSSVRRLTSSTLAAALIPSALAFDHAKVPDGVYYYGTNVGEHQIWTPLLMAENGKLIDPILHADKNGITSLEGTRKTVDLLVNTAFLYGACGTSASLYSNPSVVGKVRVAWVAHFSGESCPQLRDELLANRRRPRAERTDNPIPTFQIDRPRQTKSWIYGLQGYVAGERRPIHESEESDLGSRPDIVNAWVTSTDFVTLPVIEPDFRQVVAGGLRYRVGVAEATHRGNRLITSPELVVTAKRFVRDQLWPRYYPKLVAAIGNRFDGVAESSFELPLVQAVDIDNTRAFDYIGIARISARTNRGPIRWVDVAWSWRTGEGTTPGALSVLRTSEDALYETGNRYFSDRQPSLWSPYLVVAGFADFDKDKKLEVVTSLIRPVGIAYMKLPGSQPGTTLWLRDATIHAWEQPTPTTGRWSDVFKVVPHDGHTTSLEPGNVNITRFGG
jgi:hypothetical protein